MQSKGLPRVFSSTTVQKERVINMNSSKNLVPEREPQCSNSPAGGALLTAVLSAEAGAFS